MKIAINTCFGGFSLSHEAVMEYAKIKGFDLYPFVEERLPDGSLDFNSRKFIPYNPNEDVFIIHYSTKPLKDGMYEENSYFSDRDIPRNDPALIVVIKKLRKKANGSYANLKIVTIPDNVEWQIEEYDGLEHIAEKHRTWG